jgi:hypothetical protein
LGSVAKAAKLRAKWSQDVATRDLDGRERAPQLDEVAFAV